MNALSAWFAQSPRVVRWMVWFVGAMVVYFGVIEPALDVTQKAQLRAGTVESRIRRLVLLGNPDTDEGRVSTQVLANFGKTELPASAGEAVYLLTRRVNQAFDDAGIEDRTQIEKRSTFRPRGSDERFERIIIEVSFDARPQTISEVLAVLEASSEVTSVSRVRLDRSNRTGANAGVRTVRGTIAVEAWAKAQAHGVVR